MNGKTDVGLLLCILCRLIKYGFSPPTLEESLDERSRSVSNVDDGRAMILESKRVMCTDSQEEDGNTKRLCSSSSEV